MKVLLISCSEHLCYEPTNLIQFLEINQEFGDRVPLTANTTNIIDDTNFDIEIPFPWGRGGYENLTHAEVTLPDGSKENIYFWALLEVVQNY